MTKIYTLYYVYDNRRQCYQEDALLDQANITCKLCNAKFDSLGDVQRHVLTEHMQKETQIPIEKAEIVDTIQHNSKEKYCLISFIIKLSS